MKKQNLYFILIPIGVILCAISAILVYVKIINSNGNSDDALKFKNEYEALNGKEVKSGLFYKTINISEDNPVKYADYDELIDVIKNKTGVIYLGFKECPWCRSALPILFDVLKNNKINTLYYMDIRNIRDSYVVNDGKLEFELDSNGNEIKGEDGYFRLLEALDDVLTDYVISFDGKTYETNEKRIYAPTVIFVRSGKVVGLHVATVESQLSGYDEMTKEQIDELYSIYEDYVLEMKNDTCSSSKAC